MNTQTKDFLRHYVWWHKYHEENRRVSEEVVKQVDARIQEIKGDDLGFVGSIPYVSLANLLGIRDKLVNKDEDALLTIVAPPGKGKSSWSIFCARFVDSSFSVDRIIFTMSEFEAFLQNATNVLKDMKDKRKNGQNPDNPLSGTAIVLDEGVYMIFSGDAQSREGKQAQKLFSIIRALNLIVILNVTNFNKVNKGVVEDRIMGMWRIRKRGHLEFFSRKRVNKIEKREKGLLFPIPNYSENVGFIDKNSAFWIDYETKKAKFLEDSVTEDDTKSQEAKKKNGKRQSKEEV